MSHTPPDGALSARDRLDHLHHEVNNPLSIIRGHAQLMQRRLQHPDALDKHTLPMLLAQLAAIDLAVTRVMAAMDAYAHAEGTQREPLPALSETRKP